MPIYGQANTDLILNSVVGYLAGAQVNGLPAYKTTSAGIIKEIANTVPCGMAYLGPDASERDKLGGAIHDTITVYILSVVDYSNAAQAEIQIAAIRDAIVAIFQQRARLGDTFQVYSSYIKPGGMAFGFINSGGIDYRSHEMALEVIQEYFVPVGPGTA